MHIRIVTFQIPFSISNFVTLRDTTAFFSVHSMCTELTIAPRTVKKCDGEAKCKDDIEFYAVCESQRFFML